MKQLLLLALFNTVTIFLSAQIRLIDSATLEPIAAVNIYSDGGALLGTTNMSGYFYIDSLKREKTSTLFFQHIAYRNLMMPFVALEAVKTIKLSARAIRIEEVTVRSINDYDYVVLKGYFRNVDLFNNKTRYFVDGIISYYVPLMDKKEKTKFILQEYRIFENKELSREFENNIGKFYNDPPKLMRLNSTSIADHLPKGFRLERDKDRKFIKQGNTNMGFVQVSEEGLGQVYLDRVAPGSTINRNIFKIQGRQHTGITMENYVNVTPDHLPIDHLVSMVRSTVGDIKRKGQDRYTPMEFYSEFYVLEREYITRDQVAKNKKLFGDDVFLEGKSAYKSKYWADLEKYGIPKLPQGIGNQLEKELVERK